MFEITPDDVEEAVDDMVDAGLCVRWHTADGEPAIKLTPKGVNHFFSDPETKRRLQKYVQPRKH